MAGPKVPPPKKNRLGEAPTENDVQPIVGNSINKAGNAELVSHNFKVPAEFKREYKIFASSHDMSMVDVLMASFELYRESKGG